MSNLPPLHNPPSTNGHSNGHNNNRRGTPLHGLAGISRQAAGQASQPARRAAAAPRTEFPVPLRRTASARTWLYHLSRRRTGGAPTLRWLLLPLVLLALAWGAGWLPGRWWGVGLSLLVLVTLITVVQRWRQRDFVHFVPGPIASTEASDALAPPLTPEAKLPVYATGHFAVEEKRGRFTAMPGFYRTFATREHALLCRLNEPNFLGVGRWPADDFGMWYIFLAPENIARVETGHLHFDGQPRASLAVRHRVDVPKRGFRSGTRSVLQTVYITPCDGSHLALLLADLLHDRPPVQATDAAFDFALLESETA